MSTSATDACRKQAGRTALGYLLVSLLAALFGGVYELYSHGVYSYFMLYAFAFPLAGGALPFLLLAVRGGRKYPGRAASLLWHFGVAALTVGSIVKGVLDIYGTTNRLTVCYWIAGGGLMLAGALVYLLSRGRKSE